MLDVTAEKGGEDYPHNKESKQRRQHAPEHTEIGALVFLFKIALYKLRKKKSVLIYVAKRIPRVKKSSFFHNTSKKFYTSISLPKSIKCIQKMRKKIFLKKIKKTIDKPRKM